MNKKKVLVTGAGGFIGSHLCEFLVKNGYKVRAFIRYNSLNSWGWLEKSPCCKQIEVVTGDIRNYDSVKHAMKGINRVFHLAALIGIPYSYYSPDSYIDTNIKGTMNILQASREFGVERIVHVSTSEVYGTAQFVPINENHPVNPQSPYAASKSAADFLALSFYRSFNLPVAVARPFNTYGPRQSARAVIPTIITQMLQGKKKIKLGALKPTRDLTYVEDIVKGFMLAGESDGAVGEVINFGNNSEISIGNLAKLIAVCLNCKVTVESDSKRARPIKSEVERLMADNIKAKKILNWSPEYNLERGLKKTIAWFKENQGAYKPDIYNI